MEEGDLSEEGRSLWENVSYSVKGGEKNAIEGDIRRWAAERVLCTKVPRGGGVRPCGDEGPERLRGPGRLAIITEKRGQCADLEAPREGEEPSREGRKHELARGGLSEPLGKKRGLLSELSRSSCQEGNHGGLFHGLGDFQTQFLALNEVLEHWWLEGRV